MASPSKLLSTYLIETFMQKSYAKKVLAFLETMLDHQLEATRIEDDGDGSIRIVWENGFNKTHTATVTFFFFGPVIGEALDADPSFEKLWSVKELTPHTGQLKPLNGNDDILELTIAETLEYIRHFIWANHTV